MVVSSMNFLHIRSIVALARVCRRKLRRLRKAMYIEGEELEEEKSAESLGDINKTKKALNAILDTYSEESKDRRIIEKDEMTISYEELKDVFSEEEELSKLIQVLKKTHPEQADKVKQDEEGVRKAIQEIRGYLKKVIEEEMDSTKDNERTFRYTHLMGKQFLSGQAFQKMLNETRLIKETENEEHVIINLFKEIEEAAHKKDDKRLKELLDQFHNDLSKDENSIKELFKMVFEALHLLHIVYLHLLSMMAKNNPEGFYQKFYESLGKEGYPQHILTEIDEKYQKEARQVLEDSKVVFQMARWLGYELQSGQQQTSKAA